MKKYLLLTFAGVLFASVNAFAHCGTCGVGDKAAHEHADKAECAEACQKACCAKKAECAESCTKPCCAKPAATDAAEPTAAAAPSCCASKVTAPA